MGRASVEAVVGVSIAALALLIFGLIIMANSEREQSTQTTGLASRPHDALAFSSPAQANTIIRNGITVLSPPLLVPVINLDAQGQPTATTPALKNDTPTDSNGGKTSVGKKHRRHTGRTPAPRDTEHRIVGLAADRRKVAVGR